MRPITDGIPKIILTITDGKSNEPRETKLRADELKRREFNMISVGVGKTSITELLVLSSTANDQYYVNQFDNILKILNDITRKTCQQPIPIKEEKKISIRVEKDSYKYFKYSLTPLNILNSTSYPDEVTIELKEFTGSSDLFTSFEDQNPKSNDDYVDIKPTNREENFYEDELIRLKRNSPNSDGQTTTVSTTTEDRRP